MLYLLHYIMYKLHNYEIKYNVIIVSLILAILYTQDMTTLLKAAENQSALLLNKRKTKEKMSIRIRWEPFAVKIMAKWLKSLIALKICHRPLNEFVHLS